MTVGTIVSLFTGAMGLDLGFEQGGFEVRVAVDMDRYAIATIKANRPGLPTINGDLTDRWNLSSQLILERGGLSYGEPTVVTGATPCEPFSTIGKRLSIADERAWLIDEFIRVVEDIQPHYWCFENVPGLLWAARRHVSFYDRTVKGRGDIHEDERPGSAFQDILNSFRATGYSISYALLDAADYGAPQHRRRLIIIGARDRGTVEMPSATHGNPLSPAVARGELRPWMTLADVISDFDDPYPQCVRFPKWGEYLCLVPPGGCWKDLPGHLQEAAIGKAFYSSGGRTGFLRRLAWDRPAPSLVDSPTTKAACLCHPCDSRPLSVGEYMRVQGFPDTWRIEGPITSKYRLIGQATPVPLGRAIANTIAQHYSETAVPIGVAEVLGDVLRPF